MWKKMIVTGLSAVLLTTSAIAGDKSVETGAGFGGGAIVGAIVGGPVGAIIGSAAGAVLGRRVHEAGKVGTLTAELNQARGDMDTMQGALDDAARDLALLHDRVARDEDVRRQVENLRLEVLFRTDNSELSTESAAQLSKLALLLDAMPELGVRLDGYADPRGNTDYNVQLSSRRADSVKSLLQQNGVDQHRITLVAHGEANSTSADGDLDAYAMERRVSISLDVNDDVTTVANIE